MNRYLMLTAAALLGSTSGAMAGHVVIDNEIDVTWSGKLYAFTDLSVGDKGMGVAGWTKGIGKNVALSDYYAGDINAGYYVSVDYQLPFATGKLACRYYTTDGVTVIEAGCSAYTVDAPGKARHKGPEQSYNAR